jgi:hypothetical protein
MIAVNPLRADSMIWTPKRILLAFIEFDLCPLDCRCVCATNWALFHLEGSKREGCQYGSATLGTEAAWPQHNEAPLPASMFAMAVLIQNISRLLP